MKALWRLLVLLVALCCALVAGCAAAVSRETVDNLVTALGDEEYRVRETADRKLRRIVYAQRRGFCDLFLYMKERYETTDDAEVKTRLERILFFSLSEHACSAAELFYQAGLERYRQLRYNEAAALLRRAVWLDPDHEQARKLLYAVLWRLGEREEPVAVDEPLTSESWWVDNNLTAFCAELDRLCRLGTALMDKGSYCEAIECLEKCLEMIHWLPHSFPHEEFCRFAIAECDVRLLLGK
jgi:tetratricopeptide (TPR) repeat protein